MGLINLISGSDIESQSVYTQINNVINQSNNFLYITSTMNIRDIRQKQFKEDKIFVEDGADQNLFTFTDFQKHISEEVYEAQDFISTSDQKYILSRTIEQVFKDDDRTRISFTEMRNELFELYKFLMFYKKSNLPDETLDQIELDYSNVEKNIFKLFNAFNSNLEKLVTFLRCGEGRSSDLDESITSLFKETKVNPKMDLYLNRVKSEIDKVIQRADKIFIDGFLFFNDLQRYIIESAIKHNKQIYLIAKYSVTDQTNSFLFEDNYFKLSKELGQEITIPDVEDENYSADTALNYVKMKYPEIDMRISKDIKNKFNDGTIEIIRPFPNRDLELNFVANKVSEIVRSKCTNDINEIKTFLSEEVAIVIAAEKEKYQERLEEAFKEVGVFIYRYAENHDKSEYENIDIGTFEKVYYSRKEFLESKICAKSGEPLSYDEKYRFFKRAFQSISINKTPRPISTYPIGQYILQIYSIIESGMTIEGFKMLLYSNWNYNVDENSVKWDRYISDFKNIQVYFDGKVDIDDWIRIINNLISYKHEIKDNYLYIWHPVNHIEIESLGFLYQMLLGLKVIIDSLQDIRGSIEDHVRELRNQIVEAEKILAIDENDLSFEQKIIKRFLEAMNQIGSSSIVEGLDTNYFSDNLMGMLSDWQNETSGEFIGNLKLHVVNFENMHKFKYSFFMMCESNRYPRKYSDMFPFTEDMLDILRNKKYSINKLPAEIQGIDYHLRLEQYLFKNVLDFTTEKLFITLTEKEDKNTNKPSLYIEDITSIFDIDIRDVLVDNGVSEGNFLYFDESRRGNIRLSNKKEYSVVELGIFLLCPKLYLHLNHDKASQEITYTNRFQMRFYCEAVLYTELLNRFKEYNEASKIIYSAHDDKYYFILKSILNDCSRPVLRYFEFLNDYEIKDIKNNVLHKAIDFVDNNAIVFGKFNYFKIINETCNEFKNVGGYNFEIGVDTKVLDVSNKWGNRYQSSLYLDFLVMKNSGETVPEVHDIHGILQALESDAENLDRINLISRLVHRFNIKFSENNQYARKIAGDIYSMDFMNAQMKPTKHCMYCKLSEVCKGNHQIEKDDYNAL